MRTQSSIALSPDGRTWVLINIACDLPRQLAATPELWPAARRATPFCAIFLTDANVDHTAGLAELRQEPDPLVVVSTSIVKSLLAGERACERFARSPHTWIEATPDGGDFAAAIGAATADLMEVRAIGVPGLLPGYAGRRRETGAVVAYLFTERGSGAKVLVAPVFAALNERFLSVLAQADLALLDGSFFDDDELTATQVMSKTARGLGHVPIGGPDGTLARISALTNRRVFVHVNNTNPILDQRSAAYAAVTAAGCEVGFDGWRTELGQQYPASPAGSITHA